ncbi:MAG: nuclease-related domain-containing protein [Gammaproteobacteria bacterium]
MTNLTYVVYAALIVPWIFLFGVLATWQWLYRHRKRRSPLTSSLMRLAGYSTGKMADDMTLNLTIYLAFLPAFPLMLLGLQAVRAYQQGWPSFWAHEGFLYTGVAIAGVLVFTALSVWQFKRRQKVLEGLEAEIAVAQELDWLKARSCSVFHDLPANKFNIDHVVVGPAGVFAVETKSRLKPVTGSGRRDATVTFDGARLRFPGWSEVKPLQQAAWQARWLSGFLSKATGEAVRAIPTLALPSWFVEKTGSTEVMVINSKNCTFMARPMAGRQALSPEQIRRISYQLEQRCVIPERD